MQDSQGRILVVDDNRINRMMLQRALAQEGYSVATSENGREALDLLGVEPFDVVLLDILMPEMDGYETLALIKRSDALRHIPVIMISAVEEMDSVVRCIEMGATDYLPKPFNASLLRARINTSLAEKRLRDLEREYLEQVGYVTQAAAAVETATFDPASLDHVSARPDALGQLARVFQRMAGEVHLREQRLEQQLRQLRADIEDMHKAQLEPISVYLPVDRRHALSRGETLPDRTTGAALFADISGFTPLTSALAQELGHRRGAEELTRLLNQVYGALIAEVHAYHGSVINFGGDAITCWLDGDDGLRAVACGLAMQSAMAPFATLSTPAGSTVSLAIKVAAVAGPVRRFLVGDPAVQKVEVIAGQILDRLARGERMAGPGEVLAAADVVERAGDRITVGGWRSDTDAGERFALVRGLVAPISPCPWPELPPNALSDEQCRPWLLAPVYRSLSSGTRQFLAELRPAVALFLQFEGINYDGDDEAGLCLDAFVCWVQAIVDRYEGSLLQLTSGDKGNYLYIAFGAPLAHSDDECRAVQAALALSSLPPELGFITHLQIGIARGRVRAGAYGSSTMRTYGALGDAVNLAARLMQAATDGILCDDGIFEEARDRLAFRALPAIRVKGKTEPIPVYCPTGEPAHSAGSNAAIQAVLDRLSPAEQLTLKVASVAGLTFSTGVLHAIYPDEAGRPLIDRHLQVLERLGLIGAAGPEPGTTPAFSFRGAAIRQIAYDSMLFAQRRHLHRLAAEWYEHSCDDLAPHFATLAGHWRDAEEPALAIAYLEKASQRAMAAGEFEDAERFLQESLELSRHSAILSKELYDVATADYAAAMHHALNLLERELSPELTYHSLQHTRDEVVPAVQRLAAMIGLPQDAQRLLEVAAAFHDVGYTAHRQGHERKSADMAGQVLPQFGFSAIQTTAVQGMIMATQLPQSPHTFLEQILADADLDVLGREDFLQRSEDLRAELARSGTQSSQEHWWSSQLQMLQRHSYWTAEARIMRDPGKQQNIAALRRLTQRADN